MTAPAELRLVHTTSTQDAIADFERVEASMVALRETMGRTVFERRRALGMTLFALGRLSGDTPSDISKLERGVFARATGLARRVDEALSRAEAERA